jgi:uncharacterized protein (DUF1778 family)
MAKIVGVRLNDSEEELLEKAAEADNRKLSTFLKVSGMDKAREILDDKD